MYICISQPVLCHLSLKKKISWTMGLVFLPVLIHFSISPLSFSAIPSLKRGSQMPHQQGLPFITCWIHCSPFSLNPLTISQESQRHYAICCNTITSLSHFCIVVRVGILSTSTVLQHIPLSHERDTLWLPSSARQPSHTVAGWPPLIISCPLVLHVQDNTAQCWRRIKMIDSQPPSHRNSLGFLTKS